MQTLEPSFLSALEERIAAEEEVICKRVRSLEQQVHTLHEHKVAAQQARVLAESHQHADAELKRWEASLFSEVESATLRLEQQRQAQLDRCTAFDVALAQKILVLQQMQAAPSRSP